jgi:uncharacterized protein (DUF1800 family)
MRHWSRVMVALVLATAAVPVGGADSAVPRTADDSTIAHVLNRIGFGPRPGDVARVRSIGLERYIENQLKPGGRDVSDAALADRLASLETLRLSSRDIAERYYLPAIEARRERQRRAAADGEASATGETPSLRDMPAMEQSADARETQRRRQLVLQDMVAQKILRAVLSDRQFEETLVDFWFNHFNVFAGKGPTVLYLAEYEREAIRPHVFGKFRDLLGATARSPAMLFYLDNWQSVGNASPVGRGERMGQGLRRRRFNQPQRMPRGLNENYGRELLELHSVGVDGGYTQQDVVEVARAFTGWTIRDPRRGGEFVFHPRMHDPGEKVVLGERVNAGGEKDGERVLDLLSRHPSTAKFIATKLVRRFVSDEPPAPLVERAAKRFRDTGGDLREVYELILTSPEFFAPVARCAKVKSPFEFVVSALRATGAEVRDTRALAQSLRGLGMPLYFAQPPTGYVDRAETWVNSGALINRMNFAVALVQNRVSGVMVDLSALASRDAEDARSQLLTTLLTGDISEETRAVVAKGKEVSQVAALTIGSPEFQRR